MGPSSNSLFLPRELFAPPPVVAVEPDDDPFLAPFDAQRAPGRVDLYLPLLVRAAHVA
jgi:hypothetical protein